MKDRVYTRLDYNRLFISTDLMVDDDLLQNVDINIQYSRRSLDEIINSITCLDLVDLAIKEGN